MDLSFLKFPVRSLEKFESLQQLRERLLTLLLHSAFVLATVLYIISLVPVYQKSLSLPPVIYTVLYAWLVLVAFIKRIPYRIRAGSWAIFFYLLGVVNLVYSGLNVDSGIFFLSYVLMTALFFDLKQGLLALGVSAMSIEFFGYAVVNDYINLSLGLPQTASFLWVIGGTIFVMASLLLVLPLTVLIRGLVEYLEKSRKESEELGKTNQALRSSEERYRSLVEISPDLVTLINLDGESTLINRPGLALFGYTPEDLIGNNYQMFIAPEDRPRIREAFQRTLETGSVRDVVCRCIRKDDTLFEAEFSTSLIRDEHGNPEAVIVVGKDVTERREMERALDDYRKELEARVTERTAELKQVEESQRILLENSIQGILVFQDNKIVYVNPAMIKSIGYEPNELKSFTPAQIMGKFHPEDHAMMWQKFWERREGDSEPAHYEVRVFHKNGEIRQMVFSTVQIPFNGKPAIQLAMLDLTEHKRAEQALRESEETAKVILNATSESLILTDLEEVVLVVNQIASERMGRQPDELIGKSLRDLFPEEIARKRSIRFATVAETGEHLNFVEDFNGLSFDVNLSPVFDDYGQVVRILISARDITERKKFEQALRESEKTLRAMIDATPSSLLMLGKDGTCLAANSITSERLGVRLEEMLGMVAYQFFPEEVARSRKAYVDSVFQTGRQVMFEDFRGGYWFENHIHPIVDDDGQVRRVVVSARDMTERKQMEQALRESEGAWRIMMNATPSALGLMDSNGRLLAANKALADKLGRSIEEVLGKNMSQLLPEESARSRKARIDEVFRIGEPVQFEDHRQGVWFENHIYPIKNDTGEVIRVVFSAIDLTERMRIEEALKADKEQLEVRVTERTSELMESREQLRALTTDVVNAQEEERRRISRELHDEAGQALVSMKFSLETILADLPKKEQPIRKRLTTAVQQLDQTMDEIRFLAHSLRPPLLDIADLDLTLKDYCREFGESTKLKVDYMGDSVPRLTDLAELAFFRFLQEALTNVVKHARATRVLVRLKKRGRYLSLLVLDNGKGKKPEISEGQGHLGIQERFRILNGQVRIRSTSETGFVISTRIPYLMELDED